MTKPAAWGLPREDGSIIDVITPAQHSQLEGGYTIPLYRHPPVHNVKPVAWTDEDFTELIVSEDIAKEIGATVPLYTAPPKREPLTDAQLELIWAEFGLAMQPTRKAIARAIEAAHGIKGDA